MSSGGNLIGGTLTGGIQDISALLPLLGTQQCEHHVASALTNGFLYAAATPMSIFGSLGVALAGFKTFLAAISIPWLKLDGARILADAGFKPQGRNLSLIMLDEDQKSHCAQKRLQSMMKELHIEDSNRVAVSSKTWGWNLMMILSTAISCIISITPYIHLNLYGHNQLDNFVCWAFPVIKAFGGFLTVTMIQLLIQSRLLEIMRKQLILNGLDEAQLQDFGIRVDEKAPWTHYSLDRRCSILLRHKLVPLVEPAASTIHGPIDDSVPNDDGRRPRPESLVPTIPPSITPDRTHSTSSVNRSSHSVEHVPRATSFVQDIDLEKGVKEEAEFACPTRPRATSFIQDIDLEKVVEEEAEFASPTRQYESEAEKRRELKVLQSRIIDSCGSSILRGTFLVLLFVGILALVAGYIGCFSVVKGVESSAQALIWVSLEAGLSVLRIILWGLNPEGYDAPALQLKLKLDEHSPFPTCTSSAEHIETERVLLLVRAPEFLDAITSYTGLLKRFSDPTQALTLYYTLTRRYDTTAEAESETQLGEHVLYITIFHHTERTTRVYAEDTKIGGNATGSEMACFYSADAVTVDLEHGVLRTKIGHQIQHKDDPIAGNATLRKDLQDHYRSILNQVNYGISRPGPNDDVLENDWTLTVGETQSEMQQEGREWARRGDSTEDMKGKEKSGRYKSLDRMRDHEYLKQGQLERKVRNLILVRGQWTKDYMEWLHRDVDRVLEVDGIEIKGKERNVVETLLIQEREQMEAILLDEVYEWDQKLKSSFEDFVDKYGLDARLREQLEKSRRASLWEGREEGRLAMEARMGEGESRFLQRVADAGKDGVDEKHLKTRQLDCKHIIGRGWESHLASNPIAPPNPSDRLELRLEASANNIRTTVLGFKPSEQEFRHCQEVFQKMETRLKREVKGLEERIHRGFDACREFWSSADLVELTHSDSKWLRYYFNLPEERTDAMRRALINNNRLVTHIDAIARDTALSETEIAQFFAMIGDMAACRSISCSNWGGESIPASVELPLNILSVSDWTLSEKHEATLDWNISQLVNDQRTTFEFKSMRIWESDFHASYRGCSFTVRFLGPSSGHLKLQLIHRSTGLKNYLTVEIGEETSLEHIPHSNTFALKEIVIWNRSRSSDSSAGLTFAPDLRNTLTCKVETPDDEFPVGYDLRDIKLRDIKLLNENGSPYEPADSENGGEDSDSRSSGDSSAHVGEGGSALDQDVSE